MEGKGAFELIYDVICEIPQGKVATYGQVAELAGNRRWARVVGYALHAITEEMQIPWHRVVTREGRVFHGPQSAGGIRQTELLMREGVKFIDGNVDMKHYQWSRKRF